MGEIITIMEFIKTAPTLSTIFLAIITLAVTLYIKLKDTDINGATSISKSQNDRLLALMNQNDMLLKSVATLQEQIQTVHNQMSDAEVEHREKMEHMYKVTDDMRNRIIELEDLVRRYQTGCENCQYRKI